RLVVCELQVVRRRLHSVVPVDVIPQVERQQRRVLVDLPRARERRNRLEVLIVMDDGQEQHELLYLGRERLRGRQRVDVGDVREVADDGGASIALRLGQLLAIEGGVGRVGAA